MCDDLALPFCDAASVTVGVSGELAQWKKVRSAPRATDTQHTEGHTNTSAASTNSQALRSHTPPPLTAHRRRSEGGPTASESVHAAHRRKHSHTRSWPPSICHRSVQAMFQRPCGAPTPVRGALQPGGEPDCRMRTVPPLTERLGLRVTAGEPRCSSASVR